MPKLAVVKEQFIKEMDSLTALWKLIYARSMQNNDLKLLLYSDIGIVLGNTLISIAQRLLSKCRYLFFKTKNQKTVNLTKQKKNHVTQIILVFK